MRGRTQFAIAYSTAMFFLGAGTSLRAERADDIIEELESRYDTLTAEDLPNLESRASNGDGESQFLMGLAHLRGHLMDRDEASALKWFRLASAQGVWSADLAIAEMYQRGRGVQQNYREAMKWYASAAAHGSSRAMNNIGGMYLDGSGVIKDYAKAFEWFQKAADGGHAGAMYAIGNLYHEGRGVKRDFSLALSWYRRAAELGNVAGQYNLGVMYATGRGATQNLPEAMRWYREAAAQGDAGAMNNLGYLYQQGNGVPQNGPEAMSWYLRAIEHGALEHPAHNLARMYQDGVGMPEDVVSAYVWRTLAHWGSERDQKECRGDLPKRMSKAQVAEAESRTAEWPPARLSLCATEMVNSTGATLPPPSPTPSCGGFTSLTRHAIDELVGRAEAGDPAAQCWLGEAYIRGQGVRRNLKKSAEWHRLAAEQGHPASQYTLGNFFEYGRGVKKSTEEAMRWYLRAAEQGVAQAQSKVGLFHGHEGRHAESAEWTRKAAEQGDLMAQMNLAAMYADGRGVPRDHEKSYKWILSARAIVCGPGSEVWKRGLDQGPETTLLALRDRERAKLSREQRLKAEIAAASSRMR